jgi:BASS family bile acid:Na+ symporter
MTGDNSLKINAARMAGTLLGVQLLPLCLGLWLRQTQPGLANRLQRPASMLSTSLNLLLLAIILYVQYHILLHIRWVGYFGMLCLLVATLTSGWLMSWRASEIRKGMMITTSVRNVGVGLVIATTSFPGTAAVTAATAYAIFQTAAMAMVALIWGRVTQPGMRSATVRAA